MLPLLSALLSCFSLLAFAESSSPNVVTRPFSFNDFEALPESFASWNKFLPCQPTGNPSTDLHLVFSRNLNDHEQVKEVVETIVQAFNANPNSGWHQCFNKVVLFSAGLTEDEDIYNKYQGPVGPNLVWTRIFWNYQNKIWGDVDSFYLMEVDAQPRKPVWLDVLFEQAKGSAVFGSVHTGGKMKEWWKELTVEEQEHINGNAVYNVHSQVLQTFVDQIEKKTRNAIAGSTKALGYDLYLGEMAIKLGQAFYKSKQSVMANYASTNMVEEMFGDEYIQHGAKKWDSFKNPVSLVISTEEDARDPKLEDIFRVLKTGDHPYTEAVIFQSKGFNGKPFSLKKKDGSKMGVTYHTRKAASFSDLCESVSRVKNSHFHRMNTDHSLASKIHPFQKDGIAAQWYVDSSHSQCTDDEACAFRIQRAKAFTGADSVNKHFDDFRTTYNKQTAASFCSQWQEWRTLNPVRGFDPMPGPNADDYMAFLELILEVSSPLLNSVKWGDRPIVSRKDISASNQFTRYFYSPVEHRNLQQQNQTNTTAPTAAPTASPIGGPQIFEFKPKTQTETSSVDRSFNFTIPNVVASGYNLGDITYRWYNGYSGELTIVQPGDSVVLVINTDSAVKSTVTALAVIKGNTDSIGNSVGQSVVATYALSTAYQSSSDAQLSNVSYSLPGQSQTVVLASQESDFVFLLVIAEDSTAAIDINFDSPSKAQIISFPTLITFSANEKVDTSFNITVAAEDGTIGETMVKVQRNYTAQTRFTADCSQLTQQFTLSDKKPFFDYMNITKGELAGIVPSTYDPSVITGPVVNGTDYSGEPSTFVIPFQVITEPTGKGEPVQFTATSNGATPLVCTFDIEVFGRSNAIVLGLQQENSINTALISDESLLVATSAGDSIDVVVIPADPYSTCYPLEIKKDTLVNYQKQIDLTCTAQDGVTTTPIPLPQMTVIYTPSTFLDSLFPVEGLTSVELLPKFNKSTFLYNYEAPSSSFGFDWTYDGTDPVEAQYGGRVITNGQSVPTHFWGSTPATFFVDTGVGPSIVPREVYAVNVQSDAPSSLDWKTSDYECNSPNCDTADVLSSCDSDLGEASDGFCVILSDNTIAVRGSKAKVDTFTSSSVFNNFGASLLYTKEKTSRASRGSRGSKADRTRRGRGLLESGNAALVTLTNTEYNINVVITGKIFSTVIAEQLIPAGVRLLPLTLTTGDILYSAPSSTPIYVTFNTNSGGSAEQLITIRYENSDSGFLETIVSTVYFQQAQVNAIVSSELACNDFSGCPNGIPDQNAIYYGQSASFTVELDQDPPKGCSVVVALSQNLKFVVQSGLSISTDQSATITFTGRTTSISVSTVTDGSTDTVGTASLSYGSSGCTVSDTTPTTIRVFTKLAPLQVAVNQATPSSGDSIIAGCYVPARHVMATWFLILTYPDSSTENVRGEVQSKESNFNTTFDSFASKVGDVAYGEYQSKIQVVGVTNAGAPSPADVAVTFVTSYTTVTLSTASKKLSPTGKITITVTLGKRVLGGTTVQLMLSNSVTSSDVQVQTDVTFDENTVSLDITLVTLGTVKPGYDNEQFSLSVIPSGVISAGNYLDFTIEAEVLTITSSSINGSQFDEASTGTLDFNMSTSTDYNVPFYLYFLLNGVTYDYISIAASNPLPNFNAGDTTTAIDITMGSNGVVDAGSTLAVRTVPYATNVEVQPDSFTIFIMNTDEATVTLIPPGTTDLGQNGAVKISLNLPINAVQNFTYKLMQNGVELQAGEVTLPALAQEVSIPFTPNTAGEVVATVSVGAGTLGNFVNCDNCTASFFVTSIACIPYGGETIMVGEERSASSSVDGTSADDGILTSTTGWVGAPQSTYTIDLKHFRTVNGIKMRGNSDKNLAVTTYNMDWSSDGQTWNTGLTGAAGSVSNDYDKDAISYMASPVETAIYIRITPVTFNGANPSLRVDVIGCMNNPCNDSSTFQGKYGRCDSYATIPNSYHCDSDVVDSSQQPGTPPFVQSVCKVSCGLCGVSAATQAPTPQATTAAPTSTTPAPTQADWPAVCQDDPNFVDDYEGAWGSCAKYDESLCAGNNVYWCDHNYCEQDGANYFCPVSCGTCTQPDDPSFKSSYNGVACSYYADSSLSADQREVYCNKDTNTAPGPDYGETAAELCQNSCDSGVKRPDVEVIPDCPQADNATWTDANNDGCSAYVGPKLAYCDDSGASALDACPISCGKCNDCSALSDDVCKNLCTDSSPKSCPYANDDECYCDQYCTGMGDCCPGRNNADVCNNDNARAGRNGRNGDTRARSIDRTSRSIRNTRASSDDVSSRSTRSNRG